MTTYLPATSGVSNICPSASPLGVTVRVAVHSLLGTKLVDKVPSGETVSFDVKSKMEEKERRGGFVSISYALSVGTKPNVVKFELEGTATLEGKDAEIDKMLEMDPETQVPFVFQRVYQHMFMSMYLLATLIDAPYPPPNLLFSGEQQSPIVRTSEQAETTSETEGVVEVTAEVPEDKVAPPSAKGDLSPEA